MKKEISTKRTAHYYMQLPDSKVKFVLYAIHGYAQLAKDFLKSFKALKSSSILVVAPEALSKFYNKSGAPVANWMTSHERESEIQDYVFYLNQLQKEINRQIGKKPLAILGFSQGVSTAFRWAAQLEYAPKTIFAVCGSVPPELKTNDFESKLLQIRYYYGNRDKLLKVEQAKKEVEKIKTLGLPTQSFEFNGRHEVPQRLLQDLLKLSEKK